MYDDEALLEAAFRTLVRHFSQEEAFVTSLKRVQLLSSQVHTKRTHKGLASCWWSYAGSLVCSCRVLFGCAMSKI